MNLANTIIQQMSNILFNTVEEKRPWGSYRIIFDSKDYPYHDEEPMKIKIITVNPKQRLSLQSHKNRDETWLITSGQAAVYLEDSDFTGKIEKTIHGPQDIIFIKRGQIHRIENLSENDLLIFCEMQTGSSFEEDDIIRYEDDYGRVNEENNGTKNN